MWLEGGGTCVHGIIADRTTGDLVALRFHSGNNNPFTADITQTIGTFTDGSSGNTIQAANAVQVTAYVSNPSGQMREIKNGDF